MKKNIISLLITLFIFSIINVSAECNRAQIEGLRSQIENVEIELEYISNEITEEGIELSKTYRALGKNFPDNIYLLLYENKNSAYVISSYYVTYLKGGVYEARFYNDECGTEPIYKYQIMIPYYDEESKDDVWFDGTYLIKEKKETSDVDFSYINVRIKIAIGSIGLIFLFVIVLLISRKRRKIK